MIHGGNLYLNFNKQGLVDWNKTFSPPEREYFVLDALANIALINQGIPIPFPYTVPNVIDQNNNLDRYTVVETARGTTFPTTEEFSIMVENGVWDNE